jgi:regulation of enolase protein 1 (concanavalin A-like superfamily)
MRLLEKFDGLKIDERLTWHHEPGSWKIDNNQLHISPEAGSDFWQRTHYGFQVDNGHFLYMECQGDFTIEAQMHCKFKHQYDQAGLMIRVSDQCWVKTSVEYEPDAANKLGAVVTNQGFSDWSTQDVADDLTSYKLRISREGSDYAIAHYSEKQAEWIQMRVFHLFDQPGVKAGIYCCSPKAAGFTASFENLKIE